MKNLPPFRYYFDDEYEYRIERGSDDSGIQYTSKLNMRFWKLSERSKTLPKIPWQPAGTIYLHNDETWEKAEKRLLIGLSVTYKTITGSG